MTNPIHLGDLQIAKELDDLIRNEIAPGTGIDPDHFWHELGQLVRDLGPRNHELLQKRDHLQAQIDDWYRSNAGQAADATTLGTFLTDIGYLVPEGDDFTVNPANVDPEIAEIAGPQLVVPVDNARYALNAANARWGSLYDALYGTDVIPNSDGREKNGDYNPTRGAAVIARSQQFLDETVPLATGTHAEVTGYSLGHLNSTQSLEMTLQNGSTTGLSDPAQFVGFDQIDGQLTSILLCHHKLHIEIQIDPHHPIGKTDPAGVKDVMLEAAVTTIQDCEDSVAAVDAADKVQVYRNWNGIMQGKLETTFGKAGQTLQRRLNPDRTYHTPDGRTLTLPGRSLLLARNVGLHMYTDAITTADGQDIPEGFVDAMVTCLAAMHDLQGPNQGCNSRAGSIYIVKPKLHGPEEVAFVVELFGRIEQALGLAPNTIKIGIMDEERRTTVNLKACIRSAKERVIFINTGFLDRTGDEIHTAMMAGAMLPKSDIKNQPWLTAYEDWNVDVGIACGLVGQAQIGKGMWAMPDAMAAMLNTKMNHPQAGATTAWVPSPTAAVLHALHYHQVNVATRQQKLASRARASLDDILTPPLLNRKLETDEIQAELDNNAQGILGYVVRWVGQGVGCSKVPDIHDVGLMEDRATLRISSQHLANWLHHEVVGEAQLRATFARMAAVVDQQNSGDPDYRNMTPNLDDSIEFQAALALVLQGQQEANGYTEKVLHTKRRERKVAEMHPSASRS